MSYGGPTAWAEGLAMAATEHYCKGANDWRPGSADECSHPKHNPRRDGRSRSTVPGANTKRPEGYDFTPGHER